MSQLFLSAIHYSYTYVFDRASLLNCTVNLSSISSRTQSYFTKNMIMHHGSTFYRCHLAVSLSECEGINYEMTWKNETAPHCCS
jgi:hypothetical protein